MCVTDKETGAKSTMFLRNKGKTLRTTSITAYMDRDIGIHDPSKDDIDLWAKKFAFDVILTGCQKMVSQCASLTFYDTVIKGVKGYHSAAMGNVTINGNKIKALE